MPASGTGNIPSFTAVNNGSSAVTATITATPAPTGFAYIANGGFGVNSVSVIDIATNKITTTIPVGIGPLGVTVNHAGTLVYVGNTTGSGGINSISVINTTTNKVSATIPLNLSNGPIQMVLSPDDSKLYVTCNSNIIIFNTSTNSIITTIPAGANITEVGLAISPDGTRLYVSDGTYNDVLVINTSNYATIDDIAIGYNPHGIVLSSDGSRLYVPTGIGTITNPPTGNLNIINTVNDAILATIPVGQVPYNVVLNNDGSRAYVANSISNSVSVINTASYQVVATVTVGEEPYGLSSTADGSEIFALNALSNNVSVINTTTNTVTAAIPTGTDPDSFGNFITPGLNCGGPISFTIIIEPTVPPQTITATAPTGTISACAGTPSADPNIEQFNASGTNLTGDITVTAPTGFEVSRDIDGTYSSNLTITPALGSVGSSLVYVRSAATAPAGIISPGINVTLSSPGATDQTVPLSGTIYALPSANTPGSQLKVNGETTDPVIFTGNASTYTWVNSNTSIGLAASGAGDIPSFTAINNTEKPIIATLTVTPVNGSDCNGTPDEFYITVEPTPTVLTVTGTLTPLTTVYGTASPAESFTVSCTTVGAQILITPPPGFEVSSDGTTFSSTITVTSTTSNSPITIFIRLVSSTHFGTYSGNVTISNSNATGVTISMPESNVTPAPLTITADNKTRPFGADNPALTVSYSGFLNKDGPAQLTSLPVATTTATAASAVGQYAINVDGADSPDYTITNIAGILTITPSLSLQDIPNTFTPNGDGRNDTWVIKGLEYYPRATVNIFNRWGQKLYYSVGYPIPWNGTYHGKALPSGTYYYIIDPKTGQPVIAGWVAIVR